MRLALQLGYDDPVGGIALAQEADRLGFHSVWTSEAYGTDAVTFFFNVAATTEKTAWRWTFVRPELKLRVRDVSDLRFVMEFAVPAVTFRDTGPVVVSCFVNDRLLGSMSCPRAAQYRFEKPVPEGWVQAASDVTVRAEVDRRWVSKEDGAQLSFLLGAIGFSRGK